MRKEYEDTHEPNQEADPELAEWLRLLITPAASSEREDEEENRVCPMCGR